jgi:hypothetical protein
MPLPYEPKDFLVPAKDNPWMLDVATGWIAEAEGAAASSDNGINIFKWSTSKSDAAFGVIQTILQLTEDDERLFVRAGAGPVEDILCLCSDEFAEFIFHVARIDPRLRRAFKYVWKRDMPEERFQQVQQYAAQN